MGIKTIKTAITMPRELLKEVDRQSRKEGVSRSRFISDAVRKQLRSYSSRQITEQLNNVYANQSEKGRRDDRRLIEAFKRKFSEATEGTW